MAVVQGTYQLNRDAPLTSVNVSAPGTFAKTWLRGVSLRASWADIEPTEGNFVWTTWDTDLALAVANNKRVFLRVWPCVNGGADPPSWALSSGAQIFNYTSSKGGTQPILVPWNSIFQAKWQALITAMAAKYANHPAVDCIMMGGLDVTGGEMHLTGATTATDVTNWIAAPYSYVPTLLINAWKAIIDMYVAAFPDKRLGLNVSTPIRSTDGAVEAVMDYAISKVAYGHLLIQHNALAKKTVVTGNPQLWVNRAKGKNAVIGYQELCDAATVTGGNRWRGDSAGTAASLSEFEAGLAIGAALGQGPGCYVEAYPGNVAAYGQTAYDLYFPSPSTELLFEDFATNRTVHDGTHDLFQVYSPGGQTQTGGYSSSNHNFTTTVTSVGPSASNGAYVQWCTRGDTEDYTFPYGSAQYYVKTGTWSSLVNRFRLAITCNTAIASHSPGENIEVGNYVRSHDYTDGGQQGQHLYWISSLGTYANEPVYLFLSPQCGHLVGGNSNENQPYDWQWNHNDSFAPTPTRFMDALTRAYFDGSPDGGSSNLNTTWTLDSYYFSTVDESQEPIVSLQGGGDSTARYIHLCSPVSITYNPAAWSGAGGYELVWQAPKNLAQTYRVYYGTSSMKTNGLAAGTLSGTTVSNDGSAYTGCKWNSPALPRGNYWFAIKPVERNTRSLFTEVPYTPVGNGAQGAGTATGQASVLGSGAFISSTIKRQGVGAATGQATVLGKGLLVRRGIGQATGQAAVLGKSLTRFRAVAKANGSASILGRSRVVTRSIGRSNGSSAVVGVVTGDATLQGIGFSFGGASVLGTSRSQSRGIGFAVGSGAVVGAAQIQGDGIGFAAGRAAVLSQAVSTAEAVGHATGTSAANAAPRLQRSGIGTARGTSSVIGKCRRKRSKGSSPAVGTSRGTAAVLGRSRTITRSIAVATGRAAVIGVSSATTKAFGVGFSVGEASVLGEPNLQASAVGTATGQAAVLGDPNIQSDSIGFITGEAAVLGVSTALILSQGLAEATGQADVVGVATETVVESVGTATGQVDVSGVSRSSPSITSAASVVFRKNRFGTFTFTATGEPSPSWAVAQSLPSGLSFNTSTGVLSGTPIVSGVYLLDVTASNSKGHAGIPFILIVRAGHRLSANAEARLIATMTDVDTATEIIDAIETNADLTDRTHYSLQEAICDNDLARDIRAAIQTNGTLPDRAEHVLTQALCDLEAAREIIDAIQETDA